MKAKPILLVILTLVIGFVLGMLTSAHLRLNRLKPVRFFFSEERFREGFYKIIEPDEKQRVEIDRILEKYAKENSEMQADFRKEAEANMKEFRKEIDSKLTKDQLARLKEMDERREKMIREARKHRNDTLNRHLRPGDSRDRSYFRSRGDGQFSHRNKPPLPQPDTTEPSDNK